MHIHLSNFLIFPDWGVASLIVIVIHIDVPLSAFSACGGFGLFDTVHLQFLEKGLFLRKNVNPLS